MTLSLRVKGELQNCSIVVRQDKREIARKNMKRAIPAEMIRIPVKAETVKGNGKLEVSAEW